MTTAPLVLVTDHGPLDVVTLPAHLGPFSEMRARALDTPLGDLTVPIAHRDDLRPVGESVTEVLEYRPGRFHVVRHVRP